MSIIHLILHKATKIPNLSVFLVLLFFGAITFIFFLPVIINQEVFYAADNLLIHIPTRLMLVEQLKKGVFPLWNPYLFSGTPFLADINLATLYPSNLLYFVFNPFTALTIEIIFHVYIAMIGTYLSIRMFRCSKRNSLLGGVIYGLSGAMITYTGNVPMIHVAALLPWVFWSWQKFIQHPNSKTTALTSLVWSLQIIAGHPQLTYYSSLFCIVYTLYYMPGTLRYKVFRVCSVVFFTGLITLVQLLPFLEFALSSTRLNRGIEYATFGSLPPAALIRLILPAIVGDMSAGTEWWQGGSVYGYIGIIPLLLVILSFSHRKTTQTFIRRSLIISFLLSFGVISPLYYLAYAIIPGVSLFRVPAHFLLISTFCAAIISAQMINKLQINRHRIRYVRIASIGIGILSILFLLLPAESLATLTQPVNQLILTRKEYLTVEHLIELYRTWFWNLLFVSAGSTIITISLKKYTPFLISLFVLLDLILFSRMGIVTQPYTWVAKRWQTTIKEAEKLKAVINSHERLYVDPRLYPSLKKRIFGKETFANETEHQLKIFRPNLTMIHGIHTIDGYASIISAQYQAYFGVPAADPTGITIDSINQDEIDKVATTYLLTKPEYLKEFNNQWIIVASIDTMLLLRNSQSYPLARFIPDTMPNNVRPATATWMSANTITVNVQASESGRLVLGQPAYPGWKVSDQYNEPHTLSTDDSIFQSVKLLPGKYELTFAFVPSSVTIGLIGTVTGIITAVCMLVLRTQRDVSDRKHLHRYRE